MSDEDLMTHAYIRRWLQDELQQLFVESDVANVLDWALLHRNIPKVVVIGSGFSKNAKLATGLGGSVSERVPLWPDITNDLRHGLGYCKDDEGPWDPLLLAEQFQEANGVVEFRELLLGKLKNDEIEPGDAHNALQAYPRLKVGEAEARQHAEDPLS